MHQTISNAEEIFYAALEFEDSDARSAYLDRVCGDQELRQRVEWLLVHDALASSFLEGPASTPTVPFAHDSRSDAEEPGTLIGPYKLMEQIGDGGMGVVYVAEQHEPVRRRVALKVVKPGMDSRQMIARFEAERQALALMDHPNIAKVHDAGTTDSGRPYFVMELVKGIPITDYCRQADLSLPERLELFILVCRAVQHAHLKGIIHRDLKPSNVLVTVIDGVAVPKVIDFGVAKATGQSLTERTVYTTFQQLVGTPLYMSPEQAALSGVDVDTRSDVYSLGVLLYELLTGTTPFDRERFQAAAFDEMRRIIREEDPPTPSSRVSTLIATSGTEPKPLDGREWRRLERQLHLELDWIVMRSLEKDRNRRYETVGAFATDVRRYLDEEAVEAGPPSVWYRLRKTVRRHRHATTTVLLLGGAMIIGTGVSVWQAVRAQRAERLAEEQSSNAQDLARRVMEQSRLARDAVEELYTDVASRFPPGELTDLQRTILEKALAYYMTFLVDDDSDPELQFAAANAAERVAMIRYQLGLPEEALKAARYAVARFENQARGDPSDQDLRYSAARLYDFIGELLKYAGRVEESYPARRRAIAMLERLVAEKPEDAKYRALLASTLRGLAVDLSNLGKGREARGHRGRAIQLFEQLIAEYPDDVSYQRALAWTLTNEGSAARSAGRLDDASALTERALTILRRELDRNPDTDMLGDLVHTLYKAGRLWEAKDDPGRAEDSYIEISELIDEHFRATPTRVAFRHSLLERRCWTHFRLFNLLGQQDEHERAIHYGERAIKDAESLIKLYDQIDRYKDAYNLVLYQVAESYLTCPDNAWRDLRRGLALCRRLIEVNPNGPGYWKQLALAQVRNNDAHSAIQSMETCLQLRGTDGYAYDWLVLALAHGQQGERAQANRYFDRATVALEGNPGSDGERSQMELLHSEAATLLGRAATLNPVEIVIGGRIEPVLNLRAALKHDSPVPDGRISPGEYGPAFEVDFVTDSNPGRMFALSEESSKTLNDLSVSLSAAHTDEALHLAFEVRDQFLDTNETGDRPFQDDCIQLFINGDQIANDKIPGNQRGNREGFQIIASAVGRQHTAAVDFSNEDWKVATSRTADGYVIEFEIPLELIDTQDGEGEVAAKTGDLLLFNVMLTDNDEEVDDQKASAMLWSDDPRASTYGAGEGSWTIGLQLTPQPLPSPGTPGSPGAD